MKHFVNGFRSEVVVFIRVILCLGLMTVSLYAQPTYRTFNQNDLGTKKVAAGKIVGARASFQFINNSGSSTGALHVKFNAPVISIDTISGLTSAVNSNKKNLDLTGTINDGDTVVVSGLFNKKNIDIRATWSWGDGSIVQLNATQATVAMPVILQPNGGSVLDFLYKKVIPKKPGLVIGVVSDKHAFGWIRYTTSNPKFFPNTDTARCFDILVTSRGVVKPFWGEFKNPTVTKYNNHLLGEVHALNLAIIANDARVTMPDTPATRLGDIIYFDSTNANDPCNGKTLRQITMLADTAFTFCWIYSGIPGFYQALDASVSRINQAFDGPYHALAFTPFLLDGTHSLNEYSFLHDNPSAKTQLISTSHASIIDQPVQFALRQNYPNPFNPTTTISFSLPAESFVTLKVYNILGQEVTTLYDNQLLSDGDQSVAFNAMNLSSGVYFYKIIAQSTVDQSQKYTSVQRMVLLK